MHANRRHALAVISACSLCLACNLPDLKLTLPDICRTIQGVTLPPGSGQKETFSAGINESFDLSKAGVNPDADFEARLKLVQFTSHGSGTLEWIEEAGAVLHGPSEGALPDVSLHYARPPGTAPVGAVTVQGSDADLAPYLKGGHVKADLSFTGVLPRPPATLDVKICFQLAVPFGGK